MTDVDAIVSRLSEARRRAMERGRRYLRKAWQEPKSPLRAKLEASNG